MAGNTQIVIDLDKQRMDAMAKKDIAALNALIADDLVYTHSTARLDTKQEPDRQHGNGRDRLHLGGVRPTSRRRI